MFLVVMLRGAPLIVQTALRDGPLLDLFSFCQYRLSTVKIDNCRGQVFQALMLSLVVVVIDERLDLLLKIAGQEVVLQQYPVL